VSVLEAGPDGWQELPGWLADDDRRRRTVESEQKRDVWAALTFTRERRPLPELVDCTGCGDRFRPGDRWLERHGDRCADCTGDPLFVVA
jgi:hypothetical protein